MKKKIATKNAADERKKAKNVHVQKNNHEFCVSHHISRKIERNHSLQP